MLSFAEIPPTSYLQPLWEKLSLYNSSHSPSAEKELLLEQELTCFIVYVVSPPQ